MKYTVYALKYLDEFVHFKSGGALDLTEKPNPRSLFKTKLGAEKKIRNGLAYFESGRVIRSTNLRVTTVIIHY